MEPIFGSFLDLVRELLSEIIIIWSNWYINLFFNITYPYNLSPEVFKALTGQPLKYFMQKKRLEPLHSPSESNPIRASPIANCHQITVTVFRHCNLTKNSFAQLKKISAMIMIMIWLKISLTMTWFSWTKNFDDLFSSSSEFYRRENGYIHIYLSDK